MSSSSIDITSKCDHCGDDCGKYPIVFYSHRFCCEGCKTVFEILQENNLEDYYCINEQPGISFRNKTKDRFDYLDDAELRSKLIDYSDGEITKVTFEVPQIHCSSCVWLLENLFRLHKGILRARVNFLQKKISITFEDQSISLFALVSLLDSLGYQPTISLNDLQEKKIPKHQKSLYYRLGVAFFCFGNIMLLSFPEYFGINDLYFRKFFGYLNLALSIPITFYSAMLFFRSAWNGLRQGILNMDFPISLGIAVMFLRSAFDILVMDGGGYMDTLSSLVLLMLIGRLFQNKTYDSISFDRDYKSYFPIAVTKITGEQEQSIPLSNLLIGDRILIRHGELIPADAILFKGQASIDYSFVTGESLPLSKTLGEIIYAGGKQTGGAIELEIIKEVSHSYLTTLWNEQIFKKQEDNTVHDLANRVSSIFTITVLSIAIAAAFYWLRTDVYKAFHAFTSVLIITCPCALALSTPFTLGNALRILGKRKIYLKHTQTLEKLSKIDTIVFDKTGTLTEADGGMINYQGELLNDQEQLSLKALVRQSSHPLSQRIYEFIPLKEKIKVEYFKEFPGEGIEGLIAGKKIKIGTAKFVEPKQQFIKENTWLGTNVHISIDGNYKGYFLLKSRYRSGLKILLDQLKQQFQLFVLSGDNDAESSSLKEYFGDTNNLYFYQTPTDKLSFIQELQKKGGKVLMLGDGLNDSGALKQSDVGFALADNSNNFFPACDGMISADRFNQLGHLIFYARKCMTIIKLSFLLSFLYNIVGIYFAVQGNLSPLIAAVLMPISSVSIILFTTLSSKVFANSMK